ncbi:hypothetical protein JCM10207_002413 [Rhodosporidiobolus poonsookiae]
MDQRIRPSLADLSSSDYDAPAFPELEQGAAPAARIVRARPPTVLSTSAPPIAPIPVITPEPSSSTPAAPPPSKPKSRFALQREKEAAQRAAAERSRAERFELDLDGEDDEPVQAWRPSNRSKIIKDILERPVSRATPPQPPTAPGPPRPSPLASRPSGFPASSRGLFPRKPSQPIPAAPPPRPVLDDDYNGEEEEEADPHSVEGLLASVSRENEGVLRGMSEEEILEEQRQIREELGLSAGVLKMLAARGAKREDPKAPLLATAARPAASEKESSTPLNPLTRPLPAGAPLPAAASARGHDDEAEAKEEGSPEYIRRHFFPNEPRNPALDWMRPVPTTPRTDAPDTVAGLQLFNFDLTGARLAESASFEQPHVHSAACGEHHVSSSNSFTIPSLLSLSTSSVPSQRSTAFTVLHRILAHPSRHGDALGEKDWDSFRLQLAQKAGWGLRDANVGVVDACIALLDDLLASERDKPSKTASRLANAEEPATVLANFLSSDPLPPLAAQLGYNSLPRPTLLRILSILDSLVQFSRSASNSASSDALDALFSTPRLLDNLLSRFLSTPWPVPSLSHSAPEADLPTPCALSLLTLLASSSRARAKLLVERNFHEAPLRFLAIPPWELSAAGALSPERTLGYELVVRALELWTILARYGLATGLRTKAAPLLDGLGERMSDLARQRRTGELVDEQDVRWATAYIELLGVWTTAAVDPHVTSHDITWSQVEGWRDLGAEVVEWALSDGPEKTELLSAAWELLGSWLEGSKINRSWRGEEERKWVKEGEVGRAFEEVGRALARVEEALECLAREGTLVDGEKEARLAAAALRLSDAYAEASEPPTPQLFELDGALIERVLRALVQRPASSASTALALLLLPRLDLSLRLPLTVDLLPLLRAEDAVAARDQVDWVLRMLSSSAAASLPAFAALNLSLERPAIAKNSILRPFFTHAIVTASGGRVVAPFYPTPRDIKLTACLPSFAPSEPVLAPDWPHAALNELLRSGASPVFEQLPAGTEVSELQLVRSSLALMRVVQALASTSASRVPATALVYDLIKVFMLEKDDGEVKGSSGTDTEVFRDVAVQHSLAALLGTLSVSQQDPPQLLLPDTRPAALTIEGISATVSSAPYYQLYTDLVGLYDSISLSDRSFGLVLLPPLAMGYPADYRRLLWTDYAHLLRTLRFNVDEAISDKQGEGALSAFLEPREESEAVLAAYVDALATGTVSKDATPFLHLVAVHHVAAALFSESDAEPLRRVADKLARTLVQRRKADVVRTVLEYGQRREGEEVRMPPACYGVVDEVLRGVRVERMRKLVGKLMEEELDALVCV